MAFDIEIVNQPIRMVIESDFWGITLTIGLIIATFATAIATIFLARKTTKEHKKENDRDGTIFIFNLLNDPNNKQAEENLIARYKQYKKYDEGLIDNQHKKFYDIVRRNYFKIGELIFDEKIPDEPFYRTFGFKAVQLYCICLPEINRQKREYNIPFAAFQFTNLAIKCFEYWHEVGMDKTDPIKDPLGNRITREQLGEEMNVPRRKKKWYSKL